MLSLDSYELIFTPTKSIARPLKISHRTIKNFAETIVKKKGLRIASNLTARRTLQNAIAEVLKVKDIAGITDFWTPIVKEFIASGNDLLSLQKHNLNRVQDIAKVAIFYREQLRRNNYIDRSELFWQAAHHCNSKKSCLFYGYFTPSLDELAFINALSDHNSLLVLPIEEDDIFSSNIDSLKWLKSQKCQIKIQTKYFKQPLGKKLEQAYLNKQDLPSEVTLYSYPNLAAEVRETLTQIKLLLSKGINPQNIVIVAKDEQLYGSTLLDISWEYDIPFKAFYDVPFLTTRVGAWLQILFEVITAINDSNRLSFETVIKLLSHSLVKKIDRETWAKARLNHPQNIAEWQEIGVDLSLLQLPNKKKGDFWQIIIQNVIEYFNILQNIQPIAKEVVAYYKFKDALQELLLTTNKTFNRKQIVTEIQELLNSLTVPIQPGRGGVELHSPLSLFGSSYEYVFVLGMAENIFPTAITDDLVLGYSDREQIQKEGININTIYKIVQQEALAFYFLLQTPTKKITFSYPQLIDRQPIYISSYLTSLNLKETQVNSNYLASVEEARKIYLRQEEISDNLLIYIRHKWQIEQNRIDNIIDLYNGLTNIPLDYQKITFSASQLTQIGQCPFKWFSARILKLKEISETKLVLENNIRGSLYHKCLELCLKEINTAADLEKFNHQQLKDALQKAEKDLKLPNFLSWEHQKKELLYLLSVNLSEPEFLSLDSGIIDREKKFKTQWNGLNIKGSIDRLDRTSTGIKVIDYKTSSKPPLGIKDESGKANIDLQIPLYIDAMAQEYPNENIDAVYYSLSKHRPIRRNKNNPEELEKFAQKVKQHLTEGSYPIAPDIQLKACNYCKFDLVCRKNKK